MIKTSSYWRTHSLGRECATITQFTTSYDLDIYGYVYHGVRPRLPAFLKRNFERPLMTRRNWPIPRSSWAGAITSKLSRIVEFRRSITGTRISHKPIRDLCFDGLSSYGLPLQRTTRVVSNNLHFHQQFPQRCNGHKEDSHLKQHRLNLNVWLPPYPPQ